MVLIANNIHKDPFQTCIVNYHSETPTSIPSPSLKIPESTNMQIFLIVDVYFTIESIFSVNALGALILDQDWLQTSCDVTIHAHGPLKSDFQ